MNDSEVINELHTCHLVDLTIARGDRGLNSFTKPRHLLKMQPKALNSIRLQKKARKPCKFTNKGCIT